MINRLENRITFSLLILSSLVLGGCAQRSSPELSNTDLGDKTPIVSVKEKMLVDFEAEEDVGVLVVSNATTKEVVRNGNRAIQVDFQSASNHDSSFEFKPKDAWNFSAFSDVALAVDIENPTESSTHIYVYTYDAAGGFQLRNVVAPANSAQSYLIELKVPSLEINSGIRNNPPSWPHDYTQVIWRGGSGNPDVSGIERIMFRISGVLEDKQLIVDNLRLLQPENYDSEFLVGLVDKYGQNAKQDFSTKVATDSELIRVSTREQQSLSDNPFPGRSKFNGWLGGPKLKATGYFRAEKYQGKWALVDPEGYLFFSNGIANIRMANTSTITGYDFDEALIEQRKAGDYTPEDSIGLNRVPKKAWETRKVSSELRANMFTWLPEYSEPEAEYYGYRREVHSGAIKRGETFSFYSANLARKYGTHDSEILMDKWRDTTIKRMHTWGFTSFGNWVDPSFYQQNRIPYFANGWIIGDFKTVSSGNDYWGAMPDPFDPVFKERAEVTVKQVAEEVQGNPWCVGVFIDNEKSWGSMWGARAQYGIVINALEKSAKDSPLKLAFMNKLKEKYKSISALNSSWEVNIESWNAFADNYISNKLGKNALSDYSELLFLYAEEYFRIVDDALNRHMPNHMYMGPRFAHWAMTPEVRQAAAKYVDVMSYNYYREGIDQPYWKFLETLDMPSIIGEFHNGSMDSGLLNPGLIHAESQADRGKKYQEYMRSVIDNPYFVGAHWFQYIDSPLTGRAYDGENYNVGFVNVADIPYEPLVKAVKELNTDLYKKRFNR